ncbi:MAG: lpxK [Deferribacteraceae bacterium]|nr:lpxK [Deferribacteraceae bacterium]
MIISVGNITMGGTGKTPFVMMIGEYFLSKGNKVCVLSRGYKGQIGYETNVLSDGEKIYFIPPLAADEPYLIASRLKSAVVITGKDRTKGYEIGLKRYHCDTFILDDGFQHKRMKRDVDILLLDHNNPLSTGLVFPFGYLREFPSAIKRADIVVFNKAEEEKIPDRVHKFIKGKPVFFSNYILKGFFSANKNITNKEIATEKCVAFSGIANNRLFFRMLERNGINLTKTYSFKDHHIYSEPEIENIVKKSNGQIIITTEKDFVKIPDKYANSIYFAKIQVKMNDYEHFFKTIEEVYKKKQPV